MTARHTIRLLLIAAGLVCVVAAIRLASASKRIDHPRDVIEYLLFGWDEATEYAPGFSESIFLGVRPGMTETQVAQRLGAPLAVYRDPARGSIVTYYSRGRLTDRGYWLRWVEYDSTGRVTALRREFYSD